MYTNDFVILFRFQFQVHNMMILHHNRVYSSYIQRWGVSGLKSMTVTTWPRRPPSAIVI